MGGRIRFRWVGAVACAIALIGAASAWAADGDGDGFDDATADNCVPLKGSREGCPRADLVARVKFKPGTVKPGRAGAFTTTIRNAGPDGAPAVELLVSLPGNVSLRSKPKACKGKAPIRCKLGAVPSGAKRQIKIVVEAGPEGTATAGVSAFSGVLNESALLAAGAGDPNKKNSQGRAIWQIHS